MRSCVFSSLDLCGMLDPTRGKVLLSVRPRFATALLDGSKTVEIRRRRAHLAPGALCLVYATSPDCALVGAVRVERIDTDSPEMLWERWGEKAAVDRTEFDEYLLGCQQASAIVMSSAFRFVEPILLPELRRRRHAFVTPQSYRFLPADEYASLLNGEAHALDSLASIPLHGIAGTATR